MIEDEEVSSLFKLQHFNRSSFHTNNKLSLKLCKLLSTLIDS